jgi:2,4-dienoyl-CoA reductase-like NADH-dependent reductase (Old Yellow Enzyme family)
LTTELYPHVFQPVQIRNVVIPNRVVRAAHGTSLARAGPSAEQLAYHLARAEGGFGLTILEAAAVHPSTYGPMRAWDDSVVAGYERLMATLGKTPMKVFQQLWHAGRRALTPGGLPGWAPSPLPSQQAAVTPHEMTVVQIDELTAAFADAAVRVARGGLDGVEVHAGHGYLVGQFLSPLTNQREDDYGGSFDNRLRFLANILSAVRAKVGDKLAVGVRISAEECVPGGLVVADSIRIAQALDQQHLIDYLNISLGSHMNYAKVFGGNHEPIGYELPFSVPVARAVSVPTIVGGRIKSLEQVEKIVAAGDASMVSIVRQGVTDPTIVAKSRAGQAHRVRPCIGLNQGCLGHNGGLATTINCTVNPQAGMESRYPGLIKSAQRQRVLVIGGGPAGLEAARVAADRGHEVLLYEARPHLGGQVARARVAPYLSELGDFLDWQVGEITELGVDVRLNTEVTLELVVAHAADAVVLATGSRPRRDGFQIARQHPTMTGVERIRTSWDVLADDRSFAGQRAVVLDDVGHYEAVATADYLLERGASLVWVTRFPSLAPHMERPRLYGPIKERMSQRDFELYVDAGLVSIEPGRVTIGNLYGGAERSVPADFVVMVAPNVPVCELRMALEERVSAVHVVGDALGPRFLQTAIAEAHFAALKIGVTD